MLTIDQNCHSLWDVIAKLSALSAGGYQVRHLVEDIDVAFTAMGEEVEGGSLRLCRERFHRSGGQDWGAALFYSQGWGKLPVEIRQWEPFTGMKTNVLARQLGRSVDALYEEFSAGDNWQLIGPSYVGDRRHHRVMGDLSVAETGRFLVEIMVRAKADMLEMFGERSAQERLREWFAQEEARLERLLQQASGERLVDVYRGWLEEYLGGSVKVQMASDFFMGDGGASVRELLDLFCRDYDLAAGLYNEALVEVNSSLRPLKVREGELPFFAILEHQGHLVRTGLILQDGAIQIGDHTFDWSGDCTASLAQMRSAGVKALAGKAILLVIQLRLGEKGVPLALPYQGSLYMPAADALASKLVKQGLISGDLQPIVRVRFHLPERMKRLETIIRLPEHLVGYFGREEVSAREFGENYADIVGEATDRLESFRDGAARERWQRKRFGETIEQIEELSRRQREAAAQAAKSPRARALWQQIKSRRQEVLAGTVRQIAADYQVRQLYYWDSRGPVQPLAIGLGGEVFYEELIRRAEIYEEPTPAVLSG